ncbi:MAG: hypothetical protein QM804_15665 [Propionicimonas sp.]
MIEPIGPITAFAVAFAAGGSLAGAMTVVAMVSVFGVAGLCRGDRDSLVGGPLMDFSVDWAPLVANLIACYAVIRGWRLVKRLLWGSL